MITPRGAMADAAAVAAHYDDLDELYLDLWGFDIHHGYWITGKESQAQAVLNLTRLVAEQARIRPRDRVCDLGCGYGAAALFLSREYDARVTGLTISEKQWRRAQAAAAGFSGVEFFLRDALNNDLPDDSFDAVVAIESSEHVADKLAFLREIKRILRPGGRCAVAAWLARGRPRAWQTRYLLEPICAEGRLPSMASAEEFHRMFEDAGFQEVHALDLTRHVKKTWSLCARRLVAKYCADPGLRRLLADSRFPNRVFAKTVFRIGLAYRVGAMGYGCFSARK